MLTSFFSTTKNPQRLVLLGLLLTPVLFIKQPLWITILALLGFFLTALLLEFLSVRFGASARPNGLYWLLAGACFYGGSWTGFDWQIWLELILLALFIAGLFSLSIDGSLKDVVFATAFLGMAVLYVVSYGWLLLLLTPLAMVQWQERDLRKWWLAIVGMGSFTFLLWTFAEVFPWHRSAWTPTPRPQEDWYFVLTFLGIGVLLVILRFSLWPKKWIPTDNRRLRTMLWAMFLAGLICLTLNPDLPHIWVWIAYPFWLWMSVVFQQISRKWLADLALLLLLVSLILSPLLLQLRTTLYL